MSRIKTRDESLERLTDEIATLSKLVAELKGEAAAFDERRSLQAKIEELRKSIETLKISEARIKEDHEREKREVQHMVGLERKRQEWEHAKAMEQVESARREAVLDVREENLGKEREAFETQMKFVTERFTQEVSALQGMLVKLLPSIDIALGNRASNE